MASLFLPSYLYLNWISVENDGPTLTVRETKERLSERPLRRNCGAAADRFDSSISMLEYRLQLIGFDRIRDFSLWAFPLTRARGDLFGERS